MLSWAIHKDFKKTTVLVQCSLHGMTLWVCFEHRDPANHNAFWVCESMSQCFDILICMLVLSLSLLSSACFWFLLGEEMGRCFTIEYLMPMSVQLTSESTVSVLSKCLFIFLYPCAASCWMYEESSYALSSWRVCVCVYTNCILIILIDGYV